MSCELRSRLSERHRARWLRRSLAAVEVLVSMVNAGVHPWCRRPPSSAPAHRVSWPVWRRSRSGSAAPSTRARRSRARGARPCRNRSARAGAKDGLALISANAVSIGHGALVVDVRRASRRSPTLRCVSMEATGSNLSILEPLSPRRSPSRSDRGGFGPPGVLSGSYLDEPDTRARCRMRCLFRVARQVHRRAARADRVLPPRGRDRAELGE